LHNGVLTRVLDPRLDELLKTERQALVELRAALARFGATPADQATLDRSVEQLDELFLLVVIGEFNAGKSAFINALIGLPVLEEGVTPTTSQVTILRYGEHEQRVVVGSHLHAVTAPIDLLREIHIVDTPGTNAIIREHETITSEFVPRSDLVLFLTSADRPFTETERAFLERIRDWGKKIVFVINKMDIFERHEDAAAVRAFVAEHARRLAGVEPDVFGVSARAAQRAKRGEPALWASSGFEPLERYIKERLDGGGRARLKLENPLGVGRHLAERYLRLAEGRRTLLDADFSTLEDLERQVSLYEQDMTRDFGLRMAEIDKVLLEMEQRGHDFFDETMRIGRVFDLINRSRVQKMFEDQVVGDTPRLVERRVDDLIDWMVDADFRQWRTVTNSLANRRREHEGRLPVDDVGNFSSDRSRLIDSVGREAQRVVETYDRRRESAALAESARGAVAAAAAAGAGALGLGALVTAVATTAAADVTGLLMASAIAAIGFFILPAKRKQGKAEMRGKITRMRDRLASALRSQFEQEIKRSAGRIRESVAPYSRFVRAEGEKLAETASAFRGSLDALDRVRAELERALPQPTGSTRL
jgi:small GTP-binding protein